MTDINDLVTLADFGKEIDVTAQTVKGWIDQYAENFTGDMNDYDPVIPVAKFGNTNVYSRTRLLDLAAKRGNTKAIKTAGYVHPDKFKESESARIRLSADLASLQVQYDDQTERFDMLFDELTSMQKQYARAADELGWTRNLFSFEKETVASE